MVMSFHLRGVETTKTNIKTPLLDQIEGRKEGSQERKLIHLDIQGQKKRSPQVPLKMPPNLKISLLFDTGNNDEQPADKEVSKVDWFKKNKRPPTPDPDWNKR
ncbi:hypothetical protein Tco_1350052 [Tanacetum coccineum]